MGESMISNESPVWEISTLGSMLVEGKRGQGGDLGNGTLANAAGQPLILPPSTSAPLLDSRAHPLCKHLPLLLDWFRSGRAHSSGAVEGVSREAKLALRKAYGFKSYGAYELALYHSLGDLPEHDLAHSFC